MDTFLGIFLVTVVAAILVLLVIAAQAGLLMLGWNWAVVGFFHFLRPMGFQAACGIIILANALSILFGGIVRGRS